MNVVAINSDGEKAIVTKNLGLGKFTYFINSPVANYWLDTVDHQYLRTFFNNVIKPCGKSTPVGGELVSSGIPMAVAPFVLLLGALGVGIIIRKKRML